MLSRQEPVYGRKDKIENIEKGLNYAKDAVNLDPHDGISWAVLGNAHLSSFFGIQQNPKTLQQCLSAYIQAVSIHFLLFVQFNRNYTIIILIGKRCCSKKHSRFTL